MSCENEKSLKIDCFHSNDVTADKDRQKSLTFFTTHFQLDETIFHASDVAKHNNFEKYPMPDQIILFISNNDDDSYLVNVL